MVEDHACRKIFAALRGLLLGREIYQYDQSMGHHDDGRLHELALGDPGLLIAVLFLAGNYYLWVGMGRIPGCRALPAVHQVAAGSARAGRGWCGHAHTMIADSRELAAMGGSHHPLLGELGVMSAKNTAVNLMILSTFLSFLLYRRANIRRWCRGRRPGRASRQECS